MGLVLLLCLLVSGPALASCDAEMCPGEIWKKKLLSKVLGFSVRNQCPFLLWCPTFLQRFCERWSFYSARSGSWVLSRMAEQVHQRQLMGRRHMVQSVRKWNVMSNISRELKEAKASWMSNFDGWWFEPVYQVPTWKESEEKLHTGR